MIAVAIGLLEREAPTSNVHAKVFYRLDKKIDILERVVKEKFIVPSGTINSNVYDISLLETISNNPAVNYDKLAEILSMSRRT